MERHAEIIDDVLHITHGDGGLCSCMTVAMLEIKHYIDEYGYYPNLDRSKQFFHHKSPIHGDKDVTHHFFEKPKSDWSLFNEWSWKYGKDIHKDCMQIQWDDYRKLPFKDLLHLKRQSFHPSSEVFKKMGVLLDRLNKFDHLEYTAVIYRGNDKARETNIASHDEFIEKCKEIGGRFLVLPDECTFRTRMIKEFPESIFFEEVTCTDNKDSMPLFETSWNKRIERDQYFLAALIIAGQCKNMITHSGNVGLWASIYRGRKEGIYQYYNGKWYN